MVIGIGTDIMSIARIRKLVNPNDPFFSRTFTLVEQEIAARREDPYLFFAGRFSGKEAIFKALKISDTEFKWNEIEIAADAHFWPLVRLYGSAADHAEKLGVDYIDVSLSSDADYVTAVAIVCKQAREN
jgi:phosphopantetheine--protein transferase-like protein